VPYAYGDCGRNRYDRPVTSQLPRNSPSAAPVASAAAATPNSGGRDPSRHKWLLLKAAGSNWLEHEGARLAASLSLYTLLSLAPLIILTIALTSFAFGRPAAQHAILSEVSRVVGEEGARAVQAVITYGKTPRGANGASIIGILILLFGASSVFGELQSALNKIWEVEPGTRNSVLGWIRSRLFSFAMVLSIGFLSLVSLITSAALTTFGTYFSTVLPAPAWMLHLGNALISFLVITALIAVILKYVPDAAIRWRDVWVGAAVTAALFTLGKAAIGLYLGTAAVGSAYGAAGSLVVVIVWVYYSAMIFYFGAEFTRVHAATHLPPKQ
jgi:membrane protein